MATPKICFAVLVHHRREAVIDLLDNIRFHCPRSSIVLYNGGSDPKLCDKLGYPVCPTSRKLEYGVTAVYMLEVMKWLEDINYSYDVLVNLDSDVLFAREGFESYIAEEMKKKDYLGVGTKIPSSGFYCLVQLRTESSRWKPLLGDEPYRESFNVGQTYSRKLVRRFLSSSRYESLYRNLRKTRAFGVDELVYVTMADRFGYKLYAYKNSVARTIRYRPHFALDETILKLNGNSEAYLLHPVYRNTMDETRLFVREAMKRKIQIDPSLQKRLIGQSLGRLPYYIRRKKFDGNMMEWLAADNEEGLLYWRVVRDEADDTRQIVYGPLKFGNGKVDAIIAMETRYGNIEAVVRTDDKLVHYWRDEKRGAWNGPEVFAKGAAGMPFVLASSYGNFELIAPMKDGGLGHWYRNNDRWDQPWHGPVRFGKGQFDEVIAVENNDRQLTAVVRSSSDEHYSFYVRDDRDSWGWYGPYG